MTNKKKIIIGGVLFATIIGGVFLRPSDKEEGSTVVEKVLTQVKPLNIGDFQAGNAFVSAIGTVESQSQVELRSELSTTVTAVKVNIGDTVKKGQLLVELDHTSLDAQLRQASAAISRIQGSLDQQLAGATDESIKQSEASVKQADAAVKQAQAQLENTKIAGQNRLKTAQLALEQAEVALANSDQSSAQNVDSSYDAAINAARSGISSIKNALVSLTTLQYSYFDCFDSTICSEIRQHKAASLKTIFGVSNAGRYNAETISSLKSGVASLIEKDSLTEQEVQASLGQLLLGAESLNKLVSSTKIAASSNLGITMSASEKAQIDTIQATVDGLISSLVNAENAIKGTSVGNKTTRDNLVVQVKTARENLIATEKQIQEDIRVAEALVQSQQASLDRSEAALQALLADPRDVDLRGTRAGIAEAQASYSLIQANRDKAFITAPFDGEVAVLPVKKGELVNPGNLLVSIINEGGLQVSAYINERDRQLIQEGAVAIVEDAYDAEVAHIAPSIDPETRKVRVIASLVTDATNLLIDQFVRIKFTATPSDEQQRYLLPLTAVKTTTQGSFVFKIPEVTGDASFKLQAMPVKVGRIIGENIEILEGLTEDHEIAAYARLLKDQEEVTLKK